jgi:hypothetical protein
VTEGALEGEPSLSRSSPEARGTAFLGEELKIIDIDVGL